MILESKIHGPQAERNVVIRRRLISNMDDAKMRLFVLHAPAGYGKTILINSYMRLAETPGVWYQLGKGDNDVTTFLEYLTAAVRCVFPDFAPGCRKQCMLL